MGGRHGGDARPLPSGPFWFCEESKAQRARLVTHDQELLGGGAPSGPTGPQPHLEAQVL